MASEKEKGQRRVYVLPAELLERVLAFQKETGLPSEVEAVRRLLDDALKSRDTYTTIAERFQAKLKEVRIMSDAVADVLARHPLISMISYMDDDKVQFKLRNGICVTFSKDARYEAWDENGNRLLDDEVPF